MTAVAIIIRHTVINHACIVLLNSQKSIALWLHGFPEEWWRAFHAWVEIKTLWTRTIFLPLFSFSHRLGFEEGWFCCRELNIFLLVEHIRHAGAFTDISWCQLVLLRRFYRRLDLDHKAKRCEVVLVIFCTVYSKNVLIFADLQVLVVHVWGWGRARSFCYLWLIWANISARCIHKVNRIDLTSTLLVLTNLCE